MDYWDNYFNAHWFGLQVLSNFFDSKLPLFHNLDLLLGQAVQLIHQAIDLPVRGLDLPCEAFLLLRGLGSTFVQLEHAL